MKLAAPFMLVSALAPMQAPPGQPPLAQITIPYLPPPVDSDGTRIIAFEVLADLVGSGPITITDVAILDRGSGLPIAEYSGDALAARLTPAKLTRRGSGAPVRVYVETVLADGPPPGAIVVRVGYRAGAGTRVEASSPSYPIGGRATEVIGPPLRGGPWVAIHSPDWERGHRRVVVNWAGREHIPGRYAVDWVGVDEAGRTTRGDPDRPADAKGYGDAVLAVADAVVAEVRDGMAESTSIAANPSQPLGRASGNYVALKIASGRYVVYEHLRPGSITVRRGQRVRAGQTIGALGFTGDATGPHLHMHVATCPTPSACEGLPFAIRGMTELGRYADVEQIGKARWADTKARGAIGAEWPGSNVVVRFR